MARTRDIRPGFFKNENLGRCSPLARLLFAGLWVNADREGRLEDRPMRIKAEVLPYDECDANALLDELQQFNFITRYDSKGRFYIQINGFLENQRVHPKEPPSVIPAPEYIQSRGLSWQNSDEQVVNCTIPSIPSIPSLPPNPQGGMCRFDEFWDVYPKKVGKAAVKRSWDRHMLNKHVDSIVDAVKRYKTTETWTKDNQKFVPNPLTFINQRRWEDEIPPVAGQTARQTRAEAMLIAWNAGKCFRLKSSGAVVSADGIEPFNHLSQKVTTENPTAFRSKRTREHAFFTEFEILEE